MKSRMAVVLIVSLQFLCSRAATAQSSSSPGSDPQAVWTALAKPAFDPAKSAQVSKLEIDRDRIRITLESGSIRFTQPINGIVTGAVFRGTGKLRVSAPDARESHARRRAPP